MVRESLACLLNVDVPVGFIQGNGEIDVLAEMWAQHLIEYSLIHEEA